jgi:hypothetical protein
MGRIHAATAMSGHCNRALWASRKGQVFNYLTFIKRDEERRGYAHFKCICGKTSSHCYFSVSRGRVKSCGCKSQELKIIGHIKHGLSKSRQYHLWVSARRRARVDGREFDIELSDVVIPERCPVFGILLLTNKYRGGGRAHDDAPSLDRVNTACGYTRDNIRVISWRANRLKHAMTKAEARQLADYMESHADSL